MRSSPAKSHMVELHASELYIWQVVCINKTLFGILGPTVLVVQPLYHLINILGTKCQEMCPRNDRISSLWSLLKFHTLPPETKRVNYLLFSDSPFRELTDWNMNFTITRHRAARTHLLSVSYHTVRSVCFCNLQQQFPWRRGLKLERPFTSEFRLFWCTPCDWNTESVDFSDICKTHNVVRKMTICTTHPTKWMLYA